jgi:hypothetical protein
MVLLLSFVFKLELVICTPETFYIYEDGTAFYCLGDGHVTMRHALTISMGEISNLQSLGFGCLSGL